MKLFDDTDEDYKGPFMVWSRNHRWAISQIIENSNWSACLYQWCDSGTFSQLLKCTIAPPAKERINSTATQWNIIKAERRRKCYKWYNRD